MDNDNQNGGDKIRRFYISMTSILGAVILFMIICGCIYRCYEK